MLWSVPNFVTLSLPCEKKMQSWKVLLTFDGLWSKCWSVTIQIEPLCEYFQLVLFIFSESTKWNLEILSSFYFGDFWGWKGWGKARRLVMRICMWIWAWKVWSHLTSLSSSSVVLQPWSSLHRCDLSKNEHVYLTIWSFENKPLSASKLDKLYEWGIQMFCIFHEKGSMYSVSCIAWCSV